MKFSDLPSSLYTWNIPRQHWGTHLSNFENRYDRYDEKLYPKLESIAENLLTFNMDKNPRFVFVCGAPGNGKTHFLVGLYRALIASKGYAAGDGVMYIEFREMISEIIAGFDEKIPIRTALSAWTRPRIIIMDDVTSNERIFKEGSLEQTILRDLLIERYESKGVLVLSSNLTWKDLQHEFDRIFGDYVSSRMSDSIVVEFPRVDFRRKK
jgi:DNA replication protein DnaC